MTRRSPSRWRTTAGRLYKALVDQRTQWTQRIHAELFQHGVALPEGEIRADKTKSALTDPALATSPAARRRIAAGYTMIEATDAQAEPLKAELTRFGCRQPACRALVKDHFGVGGLTAVAIWSELGDCRRFSRSMQVVRHAGIDVTVDASDRHRASGHLSHQGPKYGGHPIKAVVADDDTMFVEHQVNAERPQAVTRQPASNPT